MMAAPSHSPQIRQLRSRVDAPFATETSPGVSRSGVGATIEQMTMIGTQFNGHLTGPASRTRSASKEDQRAVDLVLVEVGDHADATLTASEAISVCSSALLRRGARAAAPGARPTA
jgi:hypothetical protein